VSLQVTAVGVLFIEIFEKQEKDCYIDGDRLNWQLKYGRLLNAPV